MKTKHTMTALALALPATCPPAIASEGEPESLLSVLRAGTPSLDVRLRSEHVNSDAPQFPENSNANTVRARLGYTTATWSGFDAGVEYTGVSALDKMDYNSTQNGQTSRPQVADPTGNRLNQYWLRYKGVPDTTMAYGRQRIILNNARFVGNVGWRQNEATYDSASLVNTSIPGLELGYYNLINVNSIFFARFPLTGHVATVGYTLGGHKLSTYALWLDFDDANAANRVDSRTVGARGDGVMEAGPVKLVYAAEFAAQRPHGDSPSSVDAEYLLGEVGVQALGVTAKLGYEELGSNDGAYGFQTPLATLHAFNGWADTFLVTPPTGLRDTYVSLGGKVQKVALLAKYHWFKADSGGADYGTELDLQAGMPLAAGLTGLVKYAGYRSDGLAADADKFWLQFEFKL